MSLINFNEIDFNKSIDKTTTVINFNGNEILITNYLSTYDKYDLIMITLQKSFEDGIYNIIKVNTYFDLHLIYMYTNIVFSVEDRADEVALFDTMNRSGLIALVKEAIGEKELNELYSLMNRTIADLVQYNNSVKGVFSNLLQNLGDKLNILLDSLQNIEPEILEQIKNTFSKIQLSTNE